MKKTENYLDYEILRDALVEIEKKTVEPFMHSEVVYCDEDDKDSTDSTIMLRILPPYSTNVVSGVTELFCDAIRLADDIVFVNADEEDVDQSAFFIMFIVRDTKEAE